MERAAGWSEQPERTTEELEQLVDSIIDSSDIAIHGLMNKILTLIRSTTP